MKEVYRENVHRAKLVEATRAEQVAVVRGLFAEYARLVDEPACFVGLEAELEALPGEYRLLLAEAAAGCVAVRLLDARTAEMKRLYVRSAHRGKGLGRALAQAAIDVAREAGCARIVLDTLPKMREAQALYDLLGFTRIEPYLREPTPGALCYELKL
jgi:ribosomal protein S18 acetylase RimI-like enzyme